MLTKLDTALVMIPFDLAAVLIQYGAEQAFIWTGQQPRDERDFFIHCGRTLAHLQREAWQRELHRRGRAE